MALSLLHAGLPLSGHNRTAERSEPLRAEGAQVASSPRELGASSDSVVTVLSDGDALRSVCRMTTDRGPERYRHRGRRLERG